MANINVYTGPIRCGKNQKIFNELKRQLIAGKRLQTFKPALGNRNGIEFISTRSGNSIKATCINNIEELEKYDTDVYFINEFQFLDGDVSTIEKLASAGKKFYIAGLNLTSEKKPFGKMGDLMCIADKVEIMTSICEICKCDDAIYSYYNGTKKSDILIGSKQYIPVCRNCYNNLVNTQVEQKKIVNL